MAPSIVVVPGAHHVPEHFQPVTTLLQKDGYKVVAVRLPTPGDQLPPGHAGSLKVIRAAVEDELQQGNDVLLVVHSASALTGPAAIEGLITGKTRVKRILAISGILAHPGMNSVDVLHNSTPQWLGPKNGRLEVFPYDHPGKVPTKPGNDQCSPVAALYNDMTEEQKREAYDLLVPIYDDTFTAQVPYSAWKDIPLTYVVCEKDQALFAETQRELLARTGVDAEVLSLDSSHSPFISIPDQVAKLIENAANKA